jgi:hypothetical protein
VVVAGLTVTASAECPIVSTTFRTAVSVTAVSVSVFSSSCIKSYKEELGISPDCPMAANTDSLSVMKEIHSTAFVQEMVFFTRCPSDISQALLYHYTWDTISTKKAGFM